MSSLACLQMLHVLHELLNASRNIHNCLSVHAHMYTTMAYGGVQTQGGSHMNTLTFPLSQWILSSLKLQF